MSKNEIRKSRSCRCSREGLSGETQPTGEEWTPNSHSTELQVFEDWCSPLQGHLRYAYLRLDKSVHEVSNLQMNVKIITHCKISNLLLCTRGWTYISLLRGFGTLWYIFNFIKFFNILNCNSSDKVKTIFKSYFLYNFELFWEEWR